MCLGESTTQGQYPFLLEKILNQRNIGVTFSVIDKGVGGARTPVILSELESNLANYNPDMVVTMMGINDYGTHLPYEIVSISKITIFLKSSRTYKLARLLWLHILAKTREVRFCRSSEEEQHPRKIQSYKEAIERNPENSEAHFKLGRLYLIQGDSSQAEDLFRKAIALNPKNDAAYFGLGRIYRKNGKFSQAEEYFKQAAELNPKNDAAHFELGQTYQIQDKFSQAEEAFGKAIALNPQNERVYMWLGSLYQAQGKSSQAADAYKKVIELTPRNVYAYIKLGWFYQTQGKLSQAVDAYKKVIELDPQNDRVYGTLSVLCETIGNSEQAKAYAQKANRIRLEQDNFVTAHNYRALKEILDKRGIRLVYVQYPMRSIEPLKKIFQDDGEGIIFVDNERIFRDAVKKDGYSVYFKDMFGGDFGHCTDKGNRLLAENIANMILKEVFKK
jgi:tetratricopeptide (TPR) repeat protein